MWLGIGVFVVRIDAHVPSVNRRRRRRRSERRNMLGVTDGGSRNMSRPVCRIENLPALCLVWLWLVRDVLLVAQQNVQFWDVHDNTGDVPSADVMCRRRHVVEFR